MPCRAWAAALVAAHLALLLPAATFAVDEGAIMRKLRQEMHNYDPEWTASWEGWQLNDTSHPCSWDRVRCNPQKHVTILQLFRFTHPKAGGAPHHASIGSGNGTWHGPFLPELAQLPYLSELGIARSQLGSIPHAWGQAGAFPRLKQMHVESGGLDGSLPDMQRGAMPALQHLRILAPSMLSSLPASWGSSRATLPSLKALSLQLAFTGALPEAWQHGFQALDTLLLINLNMAHAAADSQAAVAAAAAPAAAAAVAVAVAAAAGPADGAGGSAADSGASNLGPHAVHAGQEATAHLPAAWANAGAFPKLTALSLSSVAVSGPLPDAWVDRGFKSLTHLSFYKIRLSGSLPPDLLSRHPLLRYILVEGNRLTGTLPDEWAASNVLQNLLLLHNALTGPAFPPAWIRAGALPDLQVLDLSYNPGLVGTLPPSLPWPKLRTLDLRQTGITGSIPASWCKWAFAMEDMFIADTGIVPRLPPCAAVDLPFLRLQTAHFIGGEQQPAGQPHDAAAALVGAAMLLGVGAAAALAVAGAVAGSVLWRHGRQQRAPYRQLPTLDCVVPLDNHQVQHGMAAGTLPSQQQGTCLGQSRRQRLTALLTAELASSGRHGIEMLPFEALPRAVTHRLGGVTATGTSSGLPSAASAGLAQHRQLADDLAPLPPASRLAVAGGAGARVSPTSEPPAGRSSSSSHLSRQWGLPTDSLRLAPGELQFAGADDGCVVELGAGSFASVYLAKLDNTPVAVKVFDLVAGMDSGNIWQEVSLLRLCTHRRIVPLYGVSLRGQVLMVAMQKMHRSLRSALWDSGTKHELRWDARGRQVALDVAEALDYLHTKMSVLHSDIKPSNVLLSEDCRAYISDLGFAQMIPGDARTGLGFSQVFAAPELLMGGRCTLAADIYSLGVTMIELTTLRPTQKRGTWCLPCAPDECPQSVVDLIQECISADAQQRPSAAQVLQRLRGDACG